MSMHGLKRLDFYEAIKDSPRFRDGLHQHEVSLANVQQHVKETSRMAAIAHENGKRFVDSLSLLIAAITQMNTVCFAHDADMCSALGLTTMAYESIHNIIKVIVEQLHWTIVKQLNDFQQNELGKVADTKAQFTRLSNAVDDVRARHCSAKTSQTVVMSKGSESAVDNVSSDSAAHSNELINVSTAFAHTSLDYAYQLNLIGVRKNHELLTAFHAFLAATRTAFKSGVEVFDEFAKDDAYIMKTIDGFTQKARALDRKMQDRHMLVPKDLYDVAVGANSPDVDIVREGYLYKRASNAVKSWQRRWFAIRHNMLLYRHRSPGESDSHFSSHKITHDGYTIMEADLRVCLVRQAPDSDRPFCFQLVTPNKTHMLQADSASLCIAWVKAIQKTIEDSILDTDSELNRNDQQKHVGSGNASPARSRITVKEATKTSTMAPSHPAPPVDASGHRRKVAECVRAVPGNEKCADCGKNNADWCSINIGVTICIECAAIHRSFGVGISKVRSLYLDALDAEQVRVMLALGNRIVNSVYEATVPENEHDIVPPRALPSSVRAVREAWCHAKYVERRFVDTPTATPRSSSDEAPARPVRRGHKSNDDTRVVVSSKDLLKRRRSTIRTWNSETRLDSALEHNTIEGTFDESQYTGGSDTHISQLEEHEQVTPSDRRLIDACARADMSAICRCLSRGADVNCRTRQTSAVCDGVIESPPRHVVYTTPLHAAVRSGSIECVEYMLLNGSKVNVVDSEMQTPLHVAVEQRATGQVIQLLKRGAAVDMKDAHGRTPLDIAVGVVGDKEHSPNADIVTLLRVSRLRDEMANDEPLMTSHMEATMQDVMDDILKSSSSHTK